MKRRNISIKTILQIINWEIAHCKQQCDGEPIQQVQAMQDGMMILKAKFNNKDKDKDFLIDHAIKLVNNEIMTCNVQSNTMPHEHIYNVENGMKIICYDLSCYQEGKDSLIKIKA